MERSPARLYISTVAVTRCLAVHRPHQLATLATPPLVDIRLSGSESLFMSENGESLNVVPR